MIKKSTLFKHVNNIEDITGDIEGLEMKMEESDFSIGEFEVEYSPSEQSVRAILNFSKSYYFLKSKILQEIDLSLN